MSSEEAFGRIRVQDTRYWNPAVEDRCQSIPRQHSLLTAATKESDATTDGHVAQRRGADRCFPEPRGIGSNLRSPCATIHRRTQPPRASVTQFCFDKTQLRHH